MAANQNLVNTKRFLLTYYSCKVVENKSTEKGTFHFFPTFDKD